MYNFHKGPRSCTFKISETLFTRQRMLEVRCKQGAQEPRDRCPAGSCWHRSLQGPLLCRHILPSKQHMDGNCICMKESIPWPSSPHFGLKCCLSPLSTTLPTKEWCFSLELLSALIGCECLQQLRCSNNCYSCLAPSGETQKLPHELFYLKMIPTCILLQKMGNMSLWPNLAELTKTMASPSLGRVKYWNRTQRRSINQPVPSCTNTTLRPQLWEVYTHLCKTFPTVVVFLNIGNEKKKKHIAPSVSICFEFWARAEGLQV